MTFAAVAGATLIATAAWLDPALPVDGRPWHGRFDPQFRKHAKHYFGAAFDWRWFKAQGIAESSLAADARSPRGALGVMQIKPATFHEVLRDHAVLPGITEPRWNIGVGIAYNRYLYQRWSEHVPAGDRFAFTLASYNAGFRRIQRARQRALAAGRRPGEWSQTAAYAPAQTRHYVTRIHRLMGRAD